MHRDQDREIPKFAVVGMAGRFPGARSVGEFWENLIAGKDSIRFFSDEEWRSAAHLRSTGDEAEMIRARAILENVELFDADFFGYRPREVSVMDPQQRLFLEQSWVALEHAGYDPSRYDGAIGVYGGVSRNTYLLNNVQHVVPHVDSLDDRQTETGNERDYVATRVAYQMDLHGPAVAVHSACSTTLLAVHYACQDLLNYQCDLALAGGASVRVPQINGYVYSETGILSRDGRCRPFDRDATGTNVGDGVGVVALKRLEDAIEDGDMIWAVVAGSAVNNDGHGKLSFMAPSVEGQAEVIACALAAADVRANEISYVECHGTGTPLGDPIEVEGLRQAFGSRLGPPCGIGSVKSNIGHLDAAAGIAGFIKVVLALHHKQIPATLHFQNPNPECRLEEGGFRVVSENVDWEPVGGVRRAGVSAFGVGGTNVHAILEEAPESPTGKVDGDRPVLLPVSAKVDAAVSERWRDLAEYFDSDACDPSLSNIAYTLTYGRKAFNQRGFVVCGSAAEASAAASEQASRQRHTTVEPQLSIAFLFPGQGAQCCGMGRELYQADEVFRTELDRCSEYASAVLDLDLRSMILERSDTGSLDETQFAQPALFAIEYAMARTWKSYGIEPKAMIGHSIGEYVAACLAGVFSVEDAIKLVCARGRVMQGAERGEMLAVLLPEEEVRQLSSPTLSLAAVNAPDSCVLSGTQSDIGQLAARLENDGIACRRLKTSHAFHSASMEPILEEFCRIARMVKMNPPRCRFVSNVTGDWITASQATDPDYWARHLRETVCFHQGVETLLAAGMNAFVEVGPGRALSGMVRRIASRGSHKVATIASLARPAEEEIRQWLEAVGSTWSLGADIQWDRLYPRPAKRVPLPTYPFQRSRYWVEPQPDSTIRLAPSTATTYESPVVSQTTAAPRAEVDPTTSPNELPASLDELPACERPPASRYERVLSELLEILRRMSGMEIADEDVETRFQDLGFDSLFLAQANAELRPRFKVRIGFRQLLEETPTPAKLARFIESKMPPEEPIESPTGQTDVDLKTAHDTVEPASTAGSNTPRDRALNGKSITGQPIHLPSPSNTGFEPVRVTVGAASTSRQSGELTARQKKGLAKLIKRYCDRTRKSKAFAEEARPKLADNRAIVGYRNAWKDLAYQVVTDGSDGARIKDIDGNEYIDLMNCFGANLLGHRFRPIVEAVEGLLQRGYEVGPQTRLAREVAEKVSAMTGAERVTFAHTGCEAVQYAIRMARAATGRKKVMFFDGDVHGRGDLFIARSFEVDGQLRTMPTAPGVPQANVSETMVLPYGSQRAIDVIRSMSDQIAAVLVEPVRTRNPDFQPINFLRQVRELTRELGICLIFDEVVTGFRVHPGGAQAYFDIRADITTYGKVLGGGLPIGAVAGRHEYLDFADGGVWSFDDGSVPESAVTRVGGTMVKHPLSMAASKALLETLEQFGPDLQRDLNRRTTRFAERVNRRFVEQGIPIHIEQFASFFKPIFLQGAEFETLFYCQLRDRGVHAYVDFPYFFSTAHTDDDIDEVAAAFEDAAKEMMEFGFLERQPSAATTPEVGLGNTDEGIVTGSLPLLPNQHRFLVERQSPHPNAWGIFGVRECRVRLDEAHLCDALNLLIRQHDALRMRLQSESSQWNAYVEEPPSQAPFSVHRIMAEDASEREQEVEREVTRLRNSLSLEQGPLIRMALFDFGELAPQRLFLMVSHLAVDGFSWARVWEDLEAAYDHVAAGRLWHPPKTESFRTWCRRLDSLAQQPDTISRMDAWLDLPWDAVPKIPRDIEAAADRNTNGSVGVWQLRLDAEVSGALNRIRLASGADLLVAAVAEAVSQWSEQPTVLLDVLGHGREEELFDETDLSRTVGFFAWYTPFVLKSRVDAPHDQRLADTLSQIDAIRQIGSMTYDLLRCLCRVDDVTARMRSLPRAEILVNWQGRFDGVFPDTQLFEAVDPGRASDAPEGLRYYLLSIRGDVIDGQWVVTFVYSRNFHEEATIRELAERVQFFLEQASLRS